MQGVCTYKRNIICRCSFNDKNTLNELGPIPFTSLEEFLNFLLNLIKNPTVLRVGIVYIASQIIWLLAMSRLEATLARSFIVNLHIIIVTILAILFLGESFYYSKLVAVLSITFAVAIFYTNKFILKQILKVA